MSQQRDEILKQIQPYLEQAFALHRRLPVAAGYFELYGHDSLFKPNGGAQCDLEKHDAAHIRCYGIAVANGSAGYFATGPDNLEVAGDQDWAYQRLLRTFDVAMGEARRCPRVKVVATAGDLPTSAADEAIRVIPLVTGHAWMRDVAAIDELFKRGLRISHAAGVSCIHWLSPCPPVKVRGRTGPVLTDFGREAVARMNELGILLDMAHVSDESADAIIAASMKPVMDGHTCSRTAIPDSRGHRDSTLRRIADSGGVAGIHFADHLWTNKVYGYKYPRNSPVAAERKSRDPMWDYNRHLLSTVSDPDERMRLRKDRAAQQAFFASYRITPPAPPPTDRIGTLGDMADHIEYMVNIMGEDHVGLGGDVNGITAHSWPDGADHVGELPHLTAELFRRGWTESRLEKFLSGNWLRLFRECLPRA